MVDTPPKLNNDFVYTLDDLNKNLIGAKSADIDALKTYRADLPQLVKQEQVYLEELIQNTNSRTIKRYKLILNSLTKLYKKQQIIYVRLHKYTYKVNNPQIKRNINIDYDNNVKNLELVAPDGGLYKWSLTQIGKTTQPNKPPDNIPSVIGKGAYGCVHSPALECADGRNSKTDSKQISKFMTKGDANNEMDEFVLIGNADKNEDFYLGKPTKCSVKNNDLNRHAVMGCKNTARFNPDRLNAYSLLLLKHGGADLIKYGNDVQTWTKNDANIRKNELFWLEVSRMLYGLKVFEENDIIHLDLKPQNIVYNEETNRINFIDFGMLTTKTQLLNKTDRYPPGYTHWSYPFETTIWSSKLYTKYTESSASVKSDIIKRLIDGIDAKCESFFYHIKADRVSHATDRVSNATLKELKMFFYQSFTEMLGEISTSNIPRKTFINKSVNTFDSYGVGMALMYMLNSSRHLMSNKLYDEMLELFLGMIDSNILDRIEIDAIIPRYHSLIRDIMNKHNKHFENNLLVDDNAKDQKTKKMIATTIKNINPSKLKSMDSSSINLTPNPCPENKDYNRSTKRCVNKCKPNQMRNAKFRCVNIPKQIRDNKQPKPCPENKDYNASTKRCVNKCKSNQTRNAKFKCVNIKKSLLPKHKSKSVPQVIDLVSTDSVI
jgi:serine/threonine protein kinase